VQNGITVRVLECHGDKSVNRYVFSKILKILQR